MFKVRNIYMYSTCTSTLYFCGNSYYIIHVCRLLEVMTNRIIDIHPVDKPISDLNSQNMFRVEVSHIKIYFYCYI